MADYHSSLLACCKMVMPHARGSPEQRCVTWLGNKIIHLIDRSHPVQMKKCILGNNGCFSTYVRPAKGLRREASANACCWTNRAMCAENSCPNIEEIQIQKEGIVNGGPLKARAPHRNMSLLGQTQIKENERYLRFTPAGRTPMDVSMSCDQTCSETASASMSS